MAKKKAAKESNFISVSTRLPSELWKKVKAHCVKADKTVQEFVMGLLTKATGK